MLLHPPGNAHKFFFFFFFWVRFHLVTFTLTKHSYIPLRLDYHLMAPNMHIQIKVLGRRLILFLDWKSSGDIKLNSFECSVLWIWVELFDNVFVLRIDNGAQMFWENVTLYLAVMNFYNNLDKRHFTLTTKYNEHERVFNNKIYQTSLE